MFLQIRNEFYLVIKLVALWEMLDGIRYSFFLIREYVSFKDVVSNGGFPINKVYLKQVPMSIKTNMTVPPPMNLHHFLPPPMRA